MKKNYPYYEPTDIKDLKQMLEIKKDEMPGKLAISFYKNEQKIFKTYRELYEDVMTLSNYFYKTYKNKKIGVTGENSYNYLVCVLAIAISGNTCVIIDKDADSKRLKAMIKTAGVSVMYYSSAYKGAINMMLINKHKIDDLTPYMKKGEKCENKYVIDPDKEAIVFFTSGTTGPNMGVALSQKNIARDIYGASCLYVPEGKGTVAFLPFHHSFGLVTGIFMPINYGEPIHISSSIKYLLRDFKENKPDTIFAVPQVVETFYKQLWKSVRKQKKDLLLKGALKISNGLLKVGIDVRKKFFGSIAKEFGGNLKYIICGGAYLDQKYIKYFRSFGIQILNGYGITECSPVVSVNRNEYQKLGSVGLPCMGVDVKIIDDEICVKGPIVMKGYVNNKTATDEVMIDGYFHTGDLGYIDEDGFIFITGRKKNIIILNNGENISPEIIEETLMKDKGVCEVVVYGENNKLVAMIYPNEEYLQDKEYFDTLIYKYNKDKAKNAQISHVVLRNTEFIKNSSMKILRNRIMED